MHIGVYIFPSAYSIRVDELARALEERGFESLFLPEHTHIPASRLSPWPGGGPIPKEYVHLMDPFVALSCAAAVTTRLRLGTGICLLPEHDPIVVAKTIATLDVLSKGRFEFGIGAGWNAEEMENHGTEFGTRFRVMSDRARALKVIWTEEECTYHGEFTDFDAIWSYPKPVQRPHPPILIGGESDHTLRRVVDFGDGWLPRARAIDPVTRLENLRALAAEAGRDPETISVSVFGAQAQAATFERYAEAGIKRALLQLPPQDREQVLPLLDTYSRLLA